MVCIFVALPQPHEWHYNEDRKVADCVYQWQWKRMKSGRSGLDGATGQHSSGFQPLVPQQSSPSNVTPLSRHPTAISDIHAQLYSTHQQKRSQDRRDDPLGLVVLHSPPERTVDILFIHGLGGTSLRTWCRDRDLGNLWPQLWLPDELPTARILTFGYNANFSSRKEQTCYTIGDFAADLLFRMRYGESTPERLGQVPIIIVAHSMGGLVFKKAFVQSHLNSEFREITSMIKAVLFLATPHRGTDLAETLNKFLSSSIFGHTPKAYIAELARRSPTIDEMNESFRHHASKLRIFSFYETLSTAIGRLSVMILDKPTAIMGYHNETPTPLAANHHNVCKFTAPTDPNYLAVVGALRSIVDAVAPLSQNCTASEDDLNIIANFLGVSAAPEEDLALGSSARKRGTCRGFMESEEFTQWLGATSGQILWAHAPPGSGKSVISSCVVENLLESKTHCSYFFFKYGQRQKQSVSNMLRSIAYQTALGFSEFRQSLLELAKPGTHLSNADSMTIWKKVFLGNLANIRSERVLHWVIDGVDEADSSKQVVELMSGIADFKTHVRVLILSRPLPSICRAFQLARERAEVVEMALPNNLNDIRCMVAEEIDYLVSDDDEFKREAVNGIATRSQGNFLWASLVTKQVVKCHRRDQVKRVLESAPDGMDRLYDRMIDVVADLEADEDKDLAKILLTWAIYAKSPVTVEELSEVYPAKLKSILNLSHTVSQVCGQFVVINTQGRVAVIHHSAREYLKNAKRRPFPLDSEGANEELFGKCLVTLCNKNLRRNIKALKVPLFLPYASTSWMAHLDSCSPESDRVLDGLVRFFSGPSPLAWIQYLAMSGRLADVLGASAKLMSYIRKRKKVDADRSPLLQRLSDMSLLETWAVDLMKLTAKFGCHLSEDPALIYKCIPALSPTSSILHQKFNENPASVLSIGGLCNQEWDDCLARVSGSDGRALRLATSSLHLAVASDMPRGTLTVWDTGLFDEVKNFSLGEHVWEITFNKSGSLLGCYSLSKTTVWRTSDWSVQRSAINPRQERAITLEWDEADVLVMVSEQRRVYKLRDSEWNQLDPSLLDEPDVPEGTFLSTPSCVAFNADCTQIVAAYRSFPMSIWNLDPPEMTARLRRRPRQGQGAANSYTGDNKVVWHPSGAEVIGISGQIFKWNPTDNAYNNVKGDIGIIPHGLVCSPNGQVFLTMDVGGSVKIYDYSSMLLIYTLSSEDRINQIRFGADSLRFYDLRGSYCNIWEPNCLLRLAEAASEQTSDTSSTLDDSFWSDTEDTPSAAISFPASESRADSMPAITAVEPGRRCHDPIAHANEDGSVSVYDPVRRKKNEITKTRFRMAIECLAWSPKHDRLAYSLNHGATTVNSVSISNDLDCLMPVDAVYAEKKSPNQRGRTKQLLFDTTGSRLLIHGIKGSQVLSMSDGVVLAEVSLPGGQHARWRQHPYEPESLLCFRSAQVVAILDWSSLEQKASFTIGLASSLPVIRVRGSDVDGEPVTESRDGMSTGGRGADLSDQSIVTLDNILDGHSSQLLLLRTTTMHLNRFRYDISVLPTSQLYAAASNLGAAKPSHQSIEPLNLPPTLVSAIAYAIGVLPDNRLVFLDKRLWVCTAALPLPEGPVPKQVDIRRHFFIPRDWVTAQGLRLCRVLRDGTFLCPTKGEVAIMRGDLVQDW